MIDKIRVSVGTASVIGLRKVRAKIKMSTAYLLTYVNSRCSQNCRFCAHAREARSSLDRVARGVYPPFDYKKVIEKLKEASEKGIIKRICLQTINHKEVMKNLENILKDLVEIAPVTLSRHPASYDELKRAKELGVDRIVIPLDAANRDIFDKIKGKHAGNTYTWENHWEGLKRAVEVFGKFRVGTHIIVGLGESERDVVETILKLNNIGVHAGLFAYVPIPGTGLNLKPPKIESYRRIQIAHYLIKNGQKRFKFKDGKIVDFGISEKELDEIIMSGKPFVVHGCPNCNRPFSTESPKGPIYNYPEIPCKEELLEIRRLVMGC